MQNESVSVKPTLLPLNTKTRWGILMARREIRGELHYVIVEPRCVSVIPAEVVEAQVAHDLRSEESMLRGTEEKL